MVLLVIYYKNHEWKQNQIPVLYFIVMSDTFLKDLVNLKIFSSSVIFRCRQNKVCVDILPLNLLRGPSLAKYMYAIRYAERMRKEEMGFVWELTFVILQYISKYFKDCYTLRFSIFRSERIWFPRNSDLKWVNPILSTHCFLSLSINGYFDIIKYTLYKFGRIILSFEHKSFLYLNFQQFVLNGLRRL